MRVRHFGLLGLVILSALFLPGSASGQSANDWARKLELLKAYPDLIVVNGKISTMDAQLREAQAMAVRDGRVITLGTNDEIRFLAGPNTEVLDAKSRRVLPGLIDGHTHPPLWAAEHWLGAEGEFTSKKYNDPQLRIVYAKGNDGAEVLRSLERVVRQRAQQLGPGKWIWVSLFAKNSIPDSREIVFPLFQQPGGPSAPITRKYLDTLAPDNPLMAFGSDALGPNVNNTRAVEQMEKLLGWEAGGLPARTAVLYDILFRGRIEEAADFLRRELLECLAAAGVTTFGNHYYGSPTTMKIFNLLYQRGEMPVRWAWFLGTLWGNEEYETRDKGDLQFFYRNLGDFQGIGNDYIWNAGVSNEAWERAIWGFGTRAKPRSPDNPSAVFPSASDSTDYEEFGGYRNVRAALESGLRITNLHTYIDGTYDALFHMIEQAIAEGKMTLEQVRALKIGTEHNPFVRPDQIAKIAKYGIMPAFNGYQIQKNDQGKLFLKDHGEQYMSWMVPMKSLADAGVHVVFNSDAHLSKVPIESKDMDYPSQWDGNIWGFIEFFVTRRMPSDGITYNRNEAMDRVTLMKAATIWGAEQVLREKHIGSLEVGKLADFIVISKDYFTIPEDQIHTIQTLLTAVGGKIVFKTQSY